MDGTSPLHRIDAAAPWEMGTESSGAVVCTVGPGKRSYCTESLAVHEDVLPVCFVIKSIKYALASLLLSPPVACLYGKSTLPPFPAH